MKYTFPDQPHLMEPIVVPLDGELLEQSYSIAINSAKLAASVHPVTAKSIGMLVSSMNCYYSNLIEGHDTRPIDIDKAMAGDYSNKPEKRILQLEAKAHIEVERKYLDLIHTGNPFPLGTETLLAIHRDFYSLLPEDLHWVVSLNGSEREKVIPGQLRARGVKVGNHVPPIHDSLEHFMRRFDDVFLREWNQYPLPMEKIPMIAAAHHRLLWIHPFLDGNGRVVRLMSVLLMKAAGIEGIGMWSPARGLARNVDQYKQLLEAADSQRKGDTDGRGNLSASALRDFVMFYINKCNDQIDFMSKMFNLDQLEPRIQHFFGIASSMKKLRPEGSRVVMETIRRGEIARGEVERITGLGERLSRDILGSMLKAGLLTSDSPKGLIKAAFPAFATEYYFPNLFPVGLSQDIPDPT